MKRICVFCGSNDGLDPRYIEAARMLARILAANDFGVVYGGSSVGLMGALADTAIECGGEVIGVLPQSLMEKEIAHTGFTELRVVNSMHERKAQMADLADGFVALPGGIGTLEELLEIWTWAQLGDHGKPCALLNVAGYYDGMVRFFDHIVAAGFMKSAHRDILIVTDIAECLIKELRDYTPPIVSKWIGRGAR